VLTAWKELIEELFSRGLGQGGGLPPKPLAAGINMLGAHNG